MLGITEIKGFDIFKDAMKKHTTEDRGKEEARNLEMSKRRMAANEKSTRSEYARK